MGLGLGLAERPTDVLLTYCAALGLVDRDVEAGDRITLTELGRRHLVAGSPFDLRPVLRVVGRTPGGRRAGGGAADGSAGGVGERAARRGRPRTGLVVQRLGDVTFAERITAAMDARGAFLAPALAAVLADVPVTALLDVGGSSGVYAAAVLAARPGARGAVFERPPVDTAARSLLAARGLADRIDVVSGDMFVDPLPPGFDVHLYSQVLHDWDAARVRHLLASSFAALPPGGLLVDHDTHVDADKRGPLPVAEYWVLLVHSTPGKCWSVGELGAMARDAGFVDVQHRAAAGDRGVVMARKPR